MSKWHLKHRLLKDHLEYYPLTGIFRWKLPRSKTVNLVGNVAGHLGSDGYWIIKLFGFNYLGHHLAWYYMTSRWPSKEVDHKDTNRSNNAWANLREATHGQNQSNCAVYKNNRLGFKGVSTIPTRPGKFRARIRKDGIERSLGVYDTPEEAQAAYVRAAQKLHGEFWRV